MNKPQHSVRINRRDFLKGVIGGIGSIIAFTYGVPMIIFLISPALRKQESDAWVPLGTLENIPIGIPTPFEFTRSSINGWERTGISYGVFAVRKDETNIRVFSNICTHLGCRVSWHEDLQHYVSPCHDGHFDLYGNNVSGPPPRPLDEYTTKVEDGILYILTPPFRRS
ncbi:MAG: hypothetical protein A2X25_11760 [Chloroflexi bacterium GWB2_49_20]|nr:MAG: hypothetical protein A2X25_11760 [Chloroflexi bacterium GWB2_49_20]OGN77681.1 MAG: hypothetical protein A2X26_10030 [Chloroflexi bacterium GWC2_49_37]OGN86456.1 MAG: hypothetical protein A2X27_06185 [Chloroflexi bacterium GWD2_49_16]HBG74701.1 hypothetical protein [Anaerolineae bacterium]